MKFLIFCILLLIVNSCTNPDHKAVPDQTKYVEMEDIFFVSDKYGIKHKVIKVDEFQAEKLKSNSDTRFCDLIYEKYKFSAYLLKDQRVLAEESGHYAIYPSKEFLIEILSTYSGPKTEESLYGKNLYKDNFPHVVDSLVEVLLKDLHINKSDDQVEILNDVDKVIIAGKRDKTFFNQYIMNMIALIGSFTLKNFHGNWEMILSEDKVTWTPCIVIRGQKLFFVDYIYEDFFDNNQPRPLLESYETIRDIIRLNFK